MQKPGHLRVYKLILKNQNGKYGFGVETKFNAIFTKLIHTHLKCSMHSGAECEYKFINSKYMFGILRVYLPVFALSAMENLIK